MEYRFSLTPRLAALGAFASVALLVLMFALGFVLGQRAGVHGAPVLAVPGHEPAAGSVADAPTAASAGGAAAPGPLTAPGAP